MNVCYQPGKDINYFFKPSGSGDGSPVCQLLERNFLKSNHSGDFCICDRYGHVCHQPEKLYAGSGIWYRCFCRSKKKVAKQFADKDEHNNLILSQNVRLSMNTRKTRRNLNVLVIGGSGAGKTLFMVKPNLLQLSRASQIITDPKGKF